LTELGAELEADPSALSEGDSVVECHELLSCLEAVVTRSVASFDSSGEYAQVGAKTAASWITKSCRTQRSEASRRVKIGRSLRHLPLTEAAFAKGWVSYAHVRVIARLKRPSTEADLARDEEMIVSWAKEHRFSDFERLCAYWLSLADEKEAEADYEASNERRDAYLVRGFSGTWLGKMTFGPLDGAVVSAELERLERALFEAEWKKAKEELGKDPQPHELARTPGQRRADAFLEMAERSMRAGEGKRPPFRLTCLIGKDTYDKLCELEDGTVVPPAALSPDLDDAYIEVVNFTYDGGFGISPTERFHRGSLRRAIKLRDRVCTHEYCEVPAKWCEVDHIKPWSEGGATTFENGRLLCGFHNRLAYKNRTAPEADP
jgi:Domain of unknown function (DUF222)/HNH endonuclease